MKKLAIALGVFGLLLAGLWWIGRRKPVVPLPPSGEEGSLFRIERVRDGMAVSYADPQAPLRSLRWLPPQPGGTVVAQVVSQNDRQQVHLFRNGAPQGSYLVPKPVGVRDGFFRIAELKDVRIVDGNVAVLLYTAPGTDDLPLVLALDLQTREVRWTHRGSGERLALADGSDAAYLFGRTTPPVRLPLARMQGEKNDPAGARSAAKAIELPPEVLEMGDLRPVSSWVFLLAHKGGLSTYLGSRGWVHRPPPEDGPSEFKGFPGRLAGGGKRLWWQPFPGTVVQVLADGTPKAVRSEFQAEEPFARDASLLRLLGGDTDGQLWFDLAVPEESTPAADSEGTTTLTLDDWPSYVQQGLDRVYRWDPGRGSLQRFRWADLPVPDGFLKPSDGKDVRPESGSLLLANGSSAWLFPLSGLPSSQPK